MITLPPPRATLAGCMWLPRIIAKARLLQSGALPSEYETRFCHPTGVDAQFLKFFGLEKEDILSAAPSFKVSRIVWELVKSVICYIHHKFMFKPKFFHS